VDTGVQSTIKRGKNQKMKSYHTQPFVKKKNGACRIEKTESGRNRVNMKKAKERNMQKM